MKICRIIYTYPPYQIGGGDIYAAKISRALVENGHEEVIISVSHLHEDIVEKIGKVKIYRIQSANIATFHTAGKKHLFLQGLWTLLDIYSLLVYFKILHILKNEKPDLVHIHTPVDVTLSVFDAVAKLGLPTVLTLHDYIYLCRKFVLLHSTGEICTQKNISPLCKIYRGFTKNLLKDKIDMVISPSEFTLDLYRENGFFLDTPARVLPHGIDLPEAPAQGGQDILSKKSKTFNILYVGGLTRHKGIHVLIHAFKMIKNQNIRLHIVGGGAYENELKSLASGDVRIVFYGKFTNIELQKFYYDSDILVVPSVWYEVRSNVIPEAFRAGIPVVGSRIGAIPEFVHDNQNGFLFPPGDATRLREILEHVLAAPDELKTLGKNALEYVKKFEMMAYIHDLVEAYGEAIKVNQRKRHGHARK